MDMYRVLLLSDVNSAHTLKWAISLAGQGLEIAIFSLSPLKVRAYRELRNIKIFTGKPLGKSVFYKAPIFKSAYVSSLPAIKTIIKEFKPDIVHAHYASSYGLLGRLSGFHPFIISVWGTDIFDFPKKGIIARSIIKKNLKSADAILSTSHIMEEETKKYTRKVIKVIPFGVDLQKFKPGAGIQIFEKGNIVIGMVKSLEKIYRINDLITAFAYIHKKYIKTKLLIVGDGTQKKELEELVKKMDIVQDVLFTEYISVDKIVEYHNTIDIFVNVPLQESFGVSVLEASACEKPVIVSNVGGLPEVVEDGVTGMVVPPANPGKIAEAIEKLANDEKLRKNMGVKGRERVEKLYNLEDNVKHMMEVYHQIINGK